MFENFFNKYPDYEIVHKPTAEQVAAYRGILPDTILSLWESHGWGVFMDGYLRLIDPALFQEFTDEYVMNVNPGCTPWAVTAFGDVIVYKPNTYIYFYNYRHAKFSVIGDGVDLDILFDHEFIEQPHIWEELNCANFPEVKTQLGVPAYDQCYGYFPLLALGGSKSVENIQIVDLQVHLELMAQVSGPL